MYDINTKNVKKGKKFYAIFIVAGAIFMAVMLFIFIADLTHQSSLDSSVMSTSVEIKQHIDDEGSTMYSPVYTYEVDGKEYQCGSNSSSSIKPSSDNTTIYYDSKNPEDCYSEYSKGANMWILGFMLIPILFIVIGVIFISKINKRVKKINELNQTGKLVKNLPYRLERSNIEINNRPLMKIVVDYRLSSGQTVTLEGDPIYENKIADEDNMVDLVIDENNPENYFLDFEINRISGNRSDDYYVDPNAPTPSTPAEQPAAPAPAPAPTPVAQPTPTYDQPQSDPQSNIPPAIKI